MRWEGGTLCAVLLTAGALACGGEEKPEPNAACEPSLPPEVLVEEVGAVRGSITVLDRRDFTLDDAGAPRAEVQGRIAGTFADFSAVTSTKSQLMALGDTCVGTIARPVSSGDVVRLDLDSFVVTGLSTGEIRPTRAGPGVYTSAQPSLLLGGGSMIRLTGEGAAGGFPSFDQTLDNISALEITEPKSDGTAELGLGELTVEWNPGDGDYALVIISPKEEMGEGGAVSCLVQDDGCFVMPAGATTFLLASQAMHYELSVERHRRRSVRLAEETTLDIELVAEHRATLINGVLEP